MTTNHISGINFAAILLLSLALSGCAIKRHWRSSEAAYDRWWVKQCVREHGHEGLTDAELCKLCDPNWKPCTTTTTIAGERVCQ